MSNARFVIVLIFVLIKYKVYCVEKPKKDVTMLGTTYNHSVTEARKSSKGQTDSVLNGLIPMLATPFLLQTTFLPAILLGVKLMLIQGIFLGKLAIILGLVNLLRNNIQDKQGHLYSHNIHANHGYDT